MPLRHVTSGQRFRGLSSATWNRLVDVANDHERFATDTPPEVDLAAELITVRNDSGTDCSRFGALALASAPILLPGNADLPAYRTHEPFWSAIPPVLPDCWDRWCVPIAPIAAGRSGLAVFRGITTATVTIRHRHHPRVEPDPDNPGTLRSCVGGRARILHREAIDSGETLPLTRLCLIELESWPRITVEGYLIDPLDPQVLGTANPTIDASCARMAVYAVVWTDPATATPGGNTGIGTNLIDTVSASSTVTINATGHGLSTSSSSGEHKITITGASAVGSLSLTGTHHITAVPSGDAVTIRSCRQASATESGGGEINWYINTPGEERVRIGQVELTNWSHQTADPGTWCRAIWMGREWGVDVLDSGEVANLDFDATDFLDLAVRNDGT